MINMSWRLEKGDNLEGEKGRLEEEVSICWPPW